MQPAGPPQPAAPVAPATAAPIRPAVPAGPATPPVPAAVTVNGKLEWIRVSEDSRRFVGVSSGRRFTPWGFNYDHDENGRLLEDYWDKEWSKVEEDFQEMKQLGANVVRIHLPFATFMPTAETPDAEEVCGVAGRLLVSLARPGALAAPGLLSAFSGGPP